MNMTISTLRRPWKKAACALIYLLLNGAAFANNLVVNRADDPSGAPSGNTLSLRQAVAAINPSTGGTITFSLPNPSTITLSNQIIISSSPGFIQIQGPGVSELSITDAGTNRAFTITNGADVLISGLTVTGCHNTTNTMGGGGILNFASLSLENCVIAGNEMGGVTNPIVGGGGIATYSNLTLVNCTISNNVDYNGSGGGIIISGVYGTAVLSNCTVSGNNVIINAASPQDASFGGGGIFNYIGSLFLVNSTIANNTVTDPGTVLTFGCGGAGILSSNGIASKCEMISCTISGNGFSGADTSSSVGGGVSGDILIGNSIVAGNSAVVSPDVYGPVTSDGFNFIGDGDDTESTLGGATGWIAHGHNGADLTGTGASPLYPLLGSLQNNGGPTWTMQPSRESAVVDQGNGFGSTFDQRGFKRPVRYLPGQSLPPGGDGSDIGAVELQPLVFVRPWPWPFGPKLQWLGNNTPGYYWLDPSNSFPQFGLETAPLNALNSNVWSPFTGQVRYYNSNDLYVALDPSNSLPGRFYRLVSPGSNVNFVIPALTLPPLPATNNTAMFNGSTTPLGSNTTWYFEYGTSTNYGFTSLSSNLPTSSNLASLGFLASGLAPETLYHYQLVVTDLDGTELGGDLIFTNVGPGKPCVAAPSGLEYWWRGEDNTLDSADDNNGTAQGSLTYTTGEVGQAFNFNGSDFVSTSVQNTNPQTFSLALWFKTTTSGGGLISFDSTQADIEDGTESYDRNIYMDNNGFLHFGIWNGSAQLASSPTNTYSNGQWHLVVGKFSSAGLALYLDGALVSTNSAIGAENYNGYWRFGQANLDNWPDNPTSEYFHGALDEVAVFGTALTASDVAAIYNAGSGGMCLP